MTFSPKPYFWDNSSDKTWYFRAETEDRFQGKTKDFDAQQLDLHRDSKTRVPVPFLAILGALGANKKPYL